MVMASISALLVGGQPAARRSRRRFLRGGILSIAPSPAPPRPAELGGRSAPASGTARLAQSPANKPRLVRSAGGIGFAVLLMLMQLGFEQAFFDSSLK